MAQVPNPSISSTTKGAQIVKMGQTTSGSHGTTITSKPPTTATPVSPTGK